MTGLTLRPDMIDDNPAVETFVGVSDVMQVFDLVSRTFGRS